MKTKLKLQLAFDHYDSYVMIQDIGKHGSEKYYAWITVSPTEGIYPDCDIIPLTQSEVLLRLELLEEHRNQPFTTEEQKAIQQVLTDKNRWYD